MSKILKVLIYIMLICSIVGCSNSESNENDIKYIENGEFNSGDIKGIYTGDTLNGIPVGNGTLITTNVESGNWTYTGEWKDGFPNGNGRMEWEDGFAYEGEFVDGGVSGITNCYKNSELLYVAEIEEGQVMGLVREKVDLLEDEPMQCVYVGEISFEIPQAWSYELIDEKTAYINIPDQQNTTVIFTAYEGLDLNKDTVREQIINNYISNFEGDFTSYSIIEDELTVNPVEEYSLQISFYSDDLLQPITDIYSKSFMRGWSDNTYTITTIQTGGIRDFSETVLCIEDTLKYWEGVQEESSKIETEEVISDLSEIEVYFVEDSEKNDTLFLKVYIKNNSQQIFSGDIHVFFYSASKERLGMDMIIVEELKPGKESWANVSIDKYDGTIALETEFSNVVFEAIEDIVSEIDNDITEKIVNSVTINFDVTSWYNDILDIKVYESGTCVVISNSIDNNTVIANAVWTCGKEYGITDIQVVDVEGKILVAYP